MSDLAGLRILVIEDEPLVALEIEEVLSEVGAVVIGPAASVERALKLVEAGGFDGALLDVNLRGERVDAVADALADKGFPFVFATGHGSEGLPTAHRGRLVLPKPYSDQHLRAALQACLPQVGAPARRPRS
jgi:CheY-like chemotaxis protein